MHIWMEEEGGEVPHSDFNFHLLAKVVAGQGSTGYLAEVTPEKMGHGEEGTSSRYTTSDFR